MSERRNKVRPGATHKTQEQMQLERAKAFARKLERAQRLDYITLIEKPKAPWLYPTIRTRPLSNKAKKETSK